MKKGRVLIFYFEVEVEGHEKEAGCFSSAPLRSSIEALRLSDGFSRV